MAAITLRLKGIPKNDAITLQGSDGTNTDSASVTAFQRPSVATGTPRASDCIAGDIMTVDTTGLTNPTNYDFRILGGASVQNGASATFDTVGQGGNDFEIVVTHDGGTATSLPIRVYTSDTASHDADDRAILALVPQNETTHWAVASGDWSAPATWNTGEVPRHGAFVHIPVGKSVTYDDTEKVRLDRVRVDGTLTWALDQDTYMMVETMVGTRGSSILMGSPGNRLPSQYTATVIVSGQDYSAHSFAATNLNAGDLVATKAWGRGIIAQGTWRIWGAQMTTWGFAEPIDAGAATLVMRQAPTGWAVDDELVIGATSMTYGTPEREQPLVTEDEYVTITAINGTDITFTPALTHPHKNQRPGSNRTDLYPVVMKRGGKNISIRSEVTGDLSKRGHTACVHGQSVMDFWDCEFIGLGRTDKVKQAGLIDENDDFKTFKRGVGLVTRTLTTESNLISRYPVHAHHCGFGRGADTAQVNNCYVEDTPGWAIVHHSCEANLDNNAMHLFKGAGMVSEQGDEIGSWVGNLAMTTTAGEGLLLNKNPKLGSPDYRGSAKTGDTFFQGYGFAFRGRAMRTNRNVAVSCGWGHVYFHRTNNDPTKDLQAVLDLDRNNIAYKDVGHGLISTDVFTTVFFPILHNSGNVAIACCGGMFITKDDSRQHHDANIHIKDFLGWGHSDVGVNIEYVATYILDGMDCIAGANKATVGTGVAGNTFQIVLRKIRSEGHVSGLDLSFGDTLLTRHDQFNDTNDPRYAVIGYKSLSNDNEIRYLSDTLFVKSGPEVTIVDDDWTDDGYDRFTDPSENHSLIIGVVDETAGMTTPTNTNIDGSKSDTLGSLAPYPIKSYTDYNFPWKSGIIIGFARNATWGGYYQYDGADHISFPHLISDRASARPRMYSHLITHTGSKSLMVDRGAFTYTTTPVTASDIQATVAVNGSVPIDVLVDASPSGGNGSFEIYENNWVEPDHGKVTRNLVTGVVTYEPDTGYSGTDFFYVFIYSAGQYATVRIDVLIGSVGTGKVTPVVDTHFAATDGGTQTIDIELFDPPDADARNIEVVQYTTNGGTNWRRLCHKWIKDTHKISVDSTGANITAGSYDVQIRYQTDYDWGYSTASVIDAVTVA